MRNDEYARLESDMLSYTDYAKIPVNPVSEPMTPVPESLGLTSRQWRREMVPYTGETVFVRKGVARRLVAAALAMKREDPRLTLEVAYGYRSLEIQRRNFEKQCALLEPFYSGDELLAAAHRRVAVPELAAHPAGAAVDIQLLRGVTPLDFGTKIWDFVPDSYTFSPYISEEARRNRMLLRSAMMGAGFAPFDGEWWHFSYGDKEWARYYNQPAAFYEQLEFRSTDPMMY